MTSSSKSTASVVVATEVKEAIDRLAKEVGASAGDVVAEAVRAYVLDRAKWMKGLEDGIEAADAGRVVGHDKVEEWLLSWGSENELDPPT